MLYNVIVFSRDQKIRFRSKDKEKMVLFLSLVADTVDGFDSGAAYVLMTTEPEAEVLTNDV